MKIVFPNGIDFIVILRIYVGLCVINISLSKCFLKRSIHENCMSKIPGCFQQLRA